MSLFLKVLQKLKLYRQNPCTRCLPDSIPTTPPPILFRVLHSGSPTVPATTTFDPIDGSLFPRNPSASAGLASAHVHLSGQHAPTPFLSLCDWVTAKRFIAFLHTQRAQDIMVVAFDTSCMRGRFYDAGEVARELGYTEQLRRVHEGEWLLLKGYKGDEHALVMVLEGFEGRMGGMVGLEEFEEHTFGITGKRWARDGNGVPERLFAIMSG